MLQHKILKTYKQGFEHNSISFSFWHNFVNISWKKHNLLASGTERAGGFAVISVAFCFVKHRKNLIKSVLVVELPGCINKNKLW